MASLSLGCLLGPNGCQQKGYTSACKKQTSTCARVQATGDGQVGPGVVPPPTYGVQSIATFGQTYGLNDATAVTTTGIAITYIYNFTLDITQGTVSGANP